MKRPSSRHLRFIAAVCLFIALATVYGGRRTLLEEVARWLNVGEPATPAEWVFLLPGDYEVRPFAAAALVTTGYAERILIPTNVHTLETAQGDDIPTHEALRKILLARGVPIASIDVLPSETDSTFGDARALSAALEKHPGMRVLVVTNDFHTRRTRWVFRQVLAAQVDQGQIHVLGVPSERFGPEDWWRTKDGFVIYTSEYVKLAAYWCAYGRGLWWGGSGLMVVVGSVWFMRRWFRRYGEMFPPTPTSSTLVASTKKMSAIEFPSEKQTQR